jgi:hypothetical protein
VLNKWEFAQKAKTELKKEKILVLFTFIFG